MRREADPARGTGARGTRWFRPGGSVHIFLTMRQSNLVRSPSEGTCPDSRTLDREHYRKTNNGISPSGPPESIRECTKKKI
jgi:hypothetical protein